MRDRLRIPALLAAIALAVPAMVAQGDDIGTPARHSRVSDFAVDTMRITAEVEPRCGVSTGLPDAAGTAAVGVDCATAITCVAVARVGETGDRLAIERKGRGRCHYRNIVRLADNGPGARLILVDF
ncbi:hypothetical protein L2U69_05085 [Zavarzinia compransoris]|uniref:hypothetical protein n=1 Tax=Zavarzinia marina TaxID=2911065 RepID=UPI001F2E898B|nr:hypothetical protein [Zavarzinia marina]MCF4165012.1 hypothetical protein [Zavarzinia marina]